jgi:membrane protein insertase Oxa1/YidC/SpoIIIJ
MIVAYALFLNNLVSMVLQMRLIDHKKETEAAKVNSKMRKLMPVIIGIILAILLPFDLRVI